MKEHFKGIRDKVEKVGKMTKILMSQDIQGMVKKLKVTKIEKRRAKQRLNFVTHK